MMIRLEGAEIILSTPSAPDFFWNPLYKKEVLPQQPVLWPTFDRKQDEEALRDDHVLVLSGHLTNEILRNMNVFDPKGSIQLARISVPPRSFTSYQAHTIFAKVLAPTLLDLIVLWGDSDDKVTTVKYTHSGDFTVLWQSELPENSKAEINDADEDANEMDAPTAFILGTLQFISTQMDRPIKEPEELIADLVNRGETAESIENVWQKCQVNSKKPASAFMYWIKTGHLPQGK